MYHKEFKRGIPKGRNPGARDLEEAGGRGRGRRGGGGERDREREREEGEGPRQQKEEKPHLSFWLKGRRWICGSNKS